MAEKEERIMIVADEPYYCNSCKKINNCSKDCKGYIQWFNRPDPIRHFYSKSEAIEKISIVLFELNSPTSWIYENAPATLKEHYKNQAEKILNKILEK